MQKLSIAAVMARTAVAAHAKDIVDTAVSAGNFRTLAAALGAADLVPTLKRKGPFTVFAPTDEAFAKIAKADQDALLKDKAKLKAVLTCHVGPGKGITVQGSDVTVSTMVGAMVNNTRVARADVAADNGVIHAIDTVLMPK